MYLSSNKKELSTIIYLLRVLIIKCDKPPLEILKHICIVGLKPGNNDTVCFDILLLMQEMLKKCNDDTKMKNFLSEIWELMREFACDFCPVTIIPEEFSTVRYSGIGIETDQKKMPLLSKVARGETSQLRIIKFVELIVSLVICTNCFDFFELIYPIIKSSNIRVFDNLMSQYLSN